MVFMKMVSEYTAGIRNNLEERGRETHAYKVLISAYSQSIITP